MSFPSTKRGAPGDLFTLSEAYGAHGPDVTAIINKNHRIVFHAIGDSGATSAGKKYGHELSVADDVTNDCRPSPEGEAATAATRVETLTVDLDTHSTTVTTG